MKLEWVNTVDWHTSEGRLVLYEMRTSKFPLDGGDDEYPVRRAEVSKQGVGVWIVEIIGPDYGVRERHEFPTEVIAKNWTEAVVRLSGETLPNW